MTTRGASRRSRWEDGFLPAVARRPSKGGGGKKRRRRWWEVGYNA